MFILVLLKPHKLKQIIKKEFKFEKYVNTESLSHSFKVLFWPIILKE